MSRKKKARKQGAGRGRAYSRLTLPERREIERRLDRGESCRSIAGALGRSPSTVSGEVARHRFVTAPRDRRGEPAPDDLGLSCPRLGEWPRCCNGCKRRRAYGCNRRPRAFYDAGMAQEAADAELSESRRGIDATEEEAARALAIIRQGLGAGLSPEQICLANPGIGVSPSTVYRWVDAGYDGMTNLDLRRKVGYKKRKGAGGAERSTRHSARRSHASFLSLGDECAGAWEMDTVEGRRGDSACLLTLLHRPSRFQLALPMAEKTSAEAVAALSGLRGALGDEGMRSVFGLVLTDNGAEFADERGIAAALCERPGETRLFYCDPRRSDQKGACEKNHVEIRKILPKGRGGVSLEGLTRADAAEVMSQVNSSPRPSLGGACPARILRAMLGRPAEALLDALGVEELGAGRLLLRPEAVNRARAERGEAPLF